MKFSASIRYLLGSCLVYVFFAACASTDRISWQADGGHGGAAAIGGFGGTDVMSSAVTGDASHNIDANELIDALTDPVPDATAEPPINGTRLKIRYVVGDDNMRSPSPTVWFDSLLGGDCLLGVTSDGLMRCVPIAYGTSTFVDATCTTPAAYAPKSTCSQAVVKYVKMPTTGANGCPAGDRFFRVGALLSPPADVYISIGGVCTKNSSINTQNYNFYAFGAEAPPSDFVRLSYEIGP